MIFDDIERPFEGAIALSEIESIEANLYDEDKTTTLIWISVGVALFFEVGILALYLFSKTVVEAH